MAWLDVNVNGYGGRLFVVYMPGVRYFGYQDWPECEHDMVVELTREIQVPLIDLILLMSASDNPTGDMAVNSPNPSLGGHYNRDGYWLVAEKILEQLGAN
jgi:hypothetical protein